MTLKLNNLSGFGAGGATWFPYPVTFDGTGDYFTSSGLTGATDSKEAIGSFWLRKDADNPDDRLFRCTASAVSRVTINNYGGSPPGNQGQVEFSFHDSGGTQRTTFRSSTVIEGALGWAHILWAFDALAGTNQCYVNDVAAITSSSSSDFAISWSDIDGVWFGSDETPANFFLDDVAEFILWQGDGTFLDLSVTANRRLFHDGAGNPVNPASAIATLGQPLIHFSNPAATWHVNRGTGGSFTLNGALEAGGDPVVEGGGAI